MELHPRRCKATQMTAPIIIKVGRYFGRIIIINKVIIIIKAGGEANCQKDGQINIVFMIMMIINIDFDDHQH